MKQFDEIAIGTWCIVVLWATIITLLCSSCSTQYIPVETVRYDSIFLAKIQKDSIFVQDSTHIKEKGDTVFVDKWKYIYKSVTKNDTIHIIRTDSIPVPYPVERKLNRWEQIKMDFGGYFLAGISLIASFYIIRWLVRKTRKRI